MVVDAARARVAEHHRRLRHGKRVLHRRLARVAQIDDHADAVHLAHHLFAERGQPVVRGRVGRAVAPRRVPAMGQRHVPRAEIIHVAQHRQARSDRMTALHAEHARDLARLHRLFELGRTGREHQVVRIALDEALHHVDLFQRLLHRLRLIAVRRDIDRPELRADMALAQPDQVGVHRNAVGGRGVAGVVEIEAVDHIVGALAQRPGHVIMPVEDRRLLERGLGHCLGRGLRGGGRRDEGESGKAGEQDGFCHGWRP